MLILSRRLGESIVIGEDINITILGVTGNQVRIGIKAPREVAVHREEIFNKIAQSNSEPTNANPRDSLSKIAVDG